MTWNWKCVTERSEGKMGSWVCRGYFCALEMKGASGAEVAGWCAVVVLLRRSFAVMWKDFALYSSTMGVTYDCTRPVEMCSKWESEVEQRYAN